MNRYKKLSTFLLIIVLLVSSIITYIASANKDYLITLKKERVIAHAMGAIDNINYTNSLEAFYSNYNKGIRVFEVDLVMTKDNHLVLRHYWDNNNLSNNKLTNRQTLNEFNEKKILEKYSSVNFDELLNLLDKYEDVYFILDIKESDNYIIKECFQYINEKLKIRNKNLINRLIPQVLSKEMYYDLKSIIDFPIIIYGLYASEFKEEEVLKFIKDEKIEIISMWGYSYNENFGKEIKKLGTNIYVHTINSKEEALEFIKSGVDGIYSDILTSKDLNDL